MTILPDLSGKGNVTFLNSLCGRMSFQNAFALATNWPTANKAYYMPFYIEKPIIIKKIYWINGNAVAGNIDAGIFDFNTGTNIISTGSTAQATASVIQAVTLANPVPLKSGFYYAGLASDTTTNSRIVHFNYGSVSSCDAFGVAQEASAFPLPATITPVQTSGTFIGPLIGIYTSLCGY
jgi:hypothetical protein